MDIPPTTWARANEAIAGLHPWLNEQTAAQIKTRYGLATYALVQDAYHTALDYPVDWTKEALDTVLPQVEHRLRQIYPFLTNESIRRLSGCFAYAWQ
ncbi:hypothetical protein [Hymenobacter chitinivorans]|uniref:Uncharacterized protein n=1 Tax=Hymenobacter chitinivorans DSM 11115 TaxID=1121954 RepID=A0A2M9B4P1_9BACT|nr:hypothetical protein [Hymenobacter chitinivorans]PJJ52914.1 hypothetical protein CLV45_3571 [Hymenobacter chitinivorans DSM 11115]